MSESVAEALPADMASEIASQLEALEIVPSPPNEADGQQAAPAEAEKPAEPATEEGEKPAAEAKDEKPKAKAKEPEKPSEPEEGAGSLSFKLQKERTAIKTERAQLAKDRAEVEDFRKQWQQHDAQYRQVQADAELLQKDPIGFALKRGFTAEQIAQRLLNGGQPGPQESAERERTASTAREQELEKRIKALEGERETATKAKARDDAYARFTKMARDGGERWPLASKVDEADLREEGDRIADALGKSGARWSFEDVLDKLEERLARLTKSTGTTAKPAKSEPGAVVVKKGDRRVAAPTIAGPTSEGAAGAADADFDYAAANEDDRRAYVMRTLSRPNGAAARN